MTVIDVYLCANSHTCCCSEQLSDACTIALLLFVFTTFGQYVICMHRWNTCDKASAQISSLGSGRCST